MTDAMNAVLTLPPLPGLLDRYNRLPLGQKMVLRLKSLLRPAASPAEFVECLKATGVRTPTGKAWSSPLVSAMEDELRRAGLLTREGACLPELVHDVAVEAMTGPEASALAVAIRRVFAGQVTTYYGVTTLPEALGRLIRLAIYLNDEADFIARTETASKYLDPYTIPAVLANGFAGIALDASWVASRHKPIRAEVLQVKLNLLIAAGDTGPDTPAIIDLCDRHRGEPGFDHLEALMQYYDLIAGRRESLRATARATSDDMADRKQSLLGAVAFLEGHNDAAITHYRDALKLRRKRLGRRKLFLEAEHRIVFLLALLHANDSRLHAEIKTGIEIAMGESPYVASDRGLLAIRAIFTLVQGIEAEARRIVTELVKIRASEPFAAACVALAEYAIDPALSLAHQDELARQFERSRDALPLIASIHAQILAEVGPRPEPYKSWLAAFPQTVTFTRLIQTLQPWQRALESLDAFLGGATKAETTPAPRKARRLAFFLDVEHEAVTAVEQSAKGRDGWTDGRPVAMKRLHEQDPRLDYLTPRDRQVLRHIRKESDGWYGEEQYDFDHHRAIAALVGHPAVFDATQRAQRLDLVSYPVELVVTEVKDGYRIELSHTAGEETVFLEAETPTRFRVIVFPKKLLTVQAILTEKGLTVPAAAREQVVAMVRRTNPTLPIRAEIAEIEQPGIEADATPVVQLLPYDAGLKLTLLVRPFGAGGPAYVAGLGGRSVLAAIDGQQRRANRDLPRELELRTALVEACPTWRDRGGAESHELVIEDLEGSLDLLLELRAYGGAVAIEWPEGRKLRVSPVETGKIKLQVAQDRDWFNVDGTITLDEDQVLEMRFLLDRLDRAHGRFVPLGEGTFVALTHQLQTQLLRLAAVAEPHRKGSRVHALGAPALEAVLGDAGEVKTDAAWKNHVARIRAAEGWTPAVPTTLRAELRDYQVEGFIWLSRLAHWGAGACLADDMGLGKTVQAIAVMLDRAAAGPCLVVAPTSVCPNWEAEIARFAPTLRTHRLPPTDDRAALIGGLGAQDVLICSYGLLHQSAETLSECDWQMVVLDEAQAIKNADTKRAQAVQSLRAGFRLALTGTPVENYLDELWSLFSFVNPGVLGSRDGFQRRFAGPIERNKDVHARQALRALIRPFLLRRTKAVVLSELPPRTEQTLNVEMTEAERAFYEALRQRSLERIAALDAPPGQRKIQILAEITRLRRACCNPALIDAAAGVPSGKLTAFMELVEELIRNRHRALVFSQFVGHLELVRAALDAQGIHYEYLDGGTPSAERERRVAAFQAGRADLFLISLRAGGTGLNLTAADYVVHLDPWWNPAVEDQASDRAHRIGQERPVTIYRLIMQDSIEERILALHRDKRDLAADLLEGTETTARLSEDALLDLIRI
jgi:superfamily II DNA or RNA helicase